MNNVPVIVVEQLPPPLAGSSPNRRKLIRAALGARRRDDIGVEGAVRQHDPDDTTQLVGELIETGPGRVDPDRKDHTTHGVAQQRPT
jgi:hypothetical protein